MSEVEVEMRLSARTNSNTHERVAAEPAAPLAFRLASDSGPREGAARTMPVTTNAVPLKAVCALEEVADSCVTDLGAKATQRSVAPAYLCVPFCL